MTPFIRHRGIAAAIRIENVDTDQIIPGRFLKTTSREGLGEGLFHSLREDQNFILNRSPWTHTSIIVALDNFGCGSSREHAPWALLDFGIRCIIAPSIADIFYGNCIRNGILPIRLPMPSVEAALSASERADTSWMTIDLEAQTLEIQDQAPIPFEISADAKHALLTGEDEITKSERHFDDLLAFEEVRTLTQAWRQAVPLLTPGSFTDQMAETA